MKNGFIDIIIKILLFIVITFAIAGTYLNILCMQLYLNFYYVVALFAFIVTSFLVFLKLLINKKLFSFSKIVSYDVKMNLDEIHEKLLSQEFIHFKDSSYIKKDKLELFVFSIVNDKIDDNYFSLLYNECLDEKEKIDSISSIILLVVDKSDKPFYKNMRFEEMEFRNTLVCGFIKEKNKLCMIESKHAKNYLKYLTLKEFVLSLFEAK